MKIFFYHCLFILLSLPAFRCTGQGTDPSGKNNKAGGGCEGCEVMYVGMPTNIYPVDTSAAWYEAGQKLLVTGKVLQRDGRTPAKDIVIYYYQTDREGRYSPTPGIDERAKLHGHIRGWVKTDKEGRYSIYTTVPGHYPARNTPAHIHVLIKEPRLPNEYYIDDFVFDDDPLLTSQERRKMKNRGGNGVLRVVHKDSLQIAEHDVILGLNIPGYPQTKGHVSTTGLQVGEDSPSFMPSHAWGADKGTLNCPLCKYGRYQGILFFVGNKPDWTDIKKWLVFLDNENRKRDRYLKTFFVYGNEAGFSKEKRRRELEELGTELNLQKTALTFVPSMNDAASEVALYKIDPLLENTFIIYRHRKIVDKHVNLKATAANFQRVSAVLDKTISPFFELPATTHN